MAQFDVFKTPGGGAFPLLVDVQADLLERLASRVVAPLVPRKKYGAKPTARLHPVVTVNGVEYVMLFHELAAYPAKALGEPIDSLAHRRNDLVAALDFLFTGI